MGHIITKGGRVVTSGNMVIRGSSGLPVIGDLYGGGIVAYILQVGDPGYEAGKTKGLIAATSDQSSGIAWITGGSTQTTLNGNTSTAIGTGAANTAAMAVQAGYTGGAAKVCLDYRGGGYSDWYLPSRNELTKIYLNKLVIGGVNLTNHWSSSEGSNTTAYMRSLSNGAEDILSKSNIGTYVLPVRSFTIG